MPELVLSGVLVSKSSKKTLIARRLLREATTGNTVEVLIFAPVPDEASEHGDWACAVEIVRATGTATLYGRGVDSLQALVSAIASLRRGIDAGLLSELVWFSTPGETGLPLVLQDMDENFLKLVESVISAEYSRQLIFQKNNRKKEGG